MIRLLSLKRFCFAAVLFVLLPVNTNAGSKVTLTPRLSLDVESTANVNLSEDNEISDVIVVITPGLEFEASEKTRGVILSYSR